MMRPSRSGAARCGSGFTLLEMLAAGGVLIVLGAIAVPALLKACDSASLAVSANNIRQLTAGGIQYLADNNQKFWNFREDGANSVDKYGNVITGTNFWFGFESQASAMSSEGSRSFDPTQGPLAGYVPKSLRPDPTFARRSKAFKPKYRSGYLGIGYNVALSGSGWMSPSKKRAQPAVSYGQLSEPSKVAVFATCAQVNDFQAPASAAQPMLEEFYGFDQTQKTVHFRHGTAAMVGFADGSCGFLPIDESTRDNRIKDANIGRFAPVGSFKYLK
jgi:prepilin-type processing-associated H-X9-DG protein